MDPILFQTEEVERAALPDAVQEHLTVMASDDDRFLYFRNAVLARAEVNRNNDEVTLQGLQELAATLPMTAIDVEHNRQKVVGFYTDARVVGDTGKEALATDGVIFKKRFPKEAEGVRMGTYRKSIEASAKKAKCSECGNEFTSAAQYCQHLIAKTGVRQLSGLTAEGGAITVIPAGTDTSFDKNSLTLVASMQEDRTKDEPVEKDTNTGEKQDNPFAAGAIRAALRFVAFADLLPANPGGQIQLASPVLAPVLWSPNEAEITRLLESVMSRVSSLNAQQFQSSTRNLTEAMEKIRDELTAHLAQFEKAHKELQAKLEASKSDGGMGVGSIGFHWIQAKEEQQENRELTWLKR